MNVILYSTGCPKCKVLEQKLDGKSVCYEKEGSVEKMLSMGIQQVPVLSVDGNLYGFKAAVEWVNKIG